MLQAGGIVVIIVFFRFQVFNKNATPRHYISFVFGTLLSLILLTPVHHFVNQMKGMVYVGLISFVLLVIWRRIALKTFVRDGIDRKKVGDGGFEPPTPSVSS